VDDARRHRRRAAVPLRLAAVWFGGGVFVGMAALLGVLFLYCQGRILQASKGIPAWREPKIVPLILATGFVEGAGLATCCSPCCRARVRAGWPACCSAP
jgi:DMSO reductase anchor subunit